MAEDIVIKVYEPRDDRDNPLLALLDRPIAYHRIFVDITGSIAGAVFLSQAFYWSRRTTKAGGWFYKTQVEWEEETGLSRREQETVRKKLRTFDWWTEELHKIDGAPTRHFRLDMRLFQKYLAENANSNWRKAPIPGNGGKRQLETHESAESIFTESTDREHTESGERKRSPRPTSAHQQMFGAVCTAVGWDYQALGKLEKAEVAQTVAILEKAGYAADQVGRFHAEVWVHDWRWTKHHSWPTLSQLRTEIGKLHATVAPARETRYIIDSNTGQRLAVEVDL